jgi:hypothetical protein
VTEAQWCVCPFPDVLLDTASRRTSSRKLRLFGVACCRRIEPLLTEPLCRHGIDVAERFAEGQADERELAETEFALEQLCQTITDSDAKAPCTAAHRCTHRIAYHAALWSAYWTAKLSSPAPRREQADLLRHIVGNPFRPIPRFVSLPAAVVQLAEAVYDGSDFAYALHDALLDAGEAELADHFRQGAWHPKGCFALDVILGKSRVYSAILSLKCRSMNVVSTRPSMNADVLKILR